jgi:hypothetical protein
MPTKRVTITREVEFDIEVEYELEETDDDGCDGPSRSMNAMTGARTGKRAVARKVRVVDEWIAMNALRETFSEDDDEVTDAMDELGDNGD